MSEIRPSISSYVSVGLDISPIYSSFPERCELCSRRKVNCCLLSSGTDYVVHFFRMDLSSALTYPYPTALSGVDARQKMKKGKNSVASSFSMFSALLFYPCRDACEQRIIIAHVLFFRKTLLFPSTKE